MTALDIVMVAVAGALVLLIVLSVVVWRYYKKLTKREEADFAVYNRYAREGGTLFLGDSLTDFFPLGEYFCDRTDMYNRGVAGNTTFDVLGRIDNATALKPKTVFLLVGVNDLIYLSGRKSAPGPLTDRILKIASAFPQAKVYVISLYPVNRKKTLFAKAICLKANNRRILAINALLKEKSERAGYTYLDVHSMLKDETGNLKPDYTVEGLHLTADGYCAVASALQPYLEA